MAAKAAGGAETQSWDDFWAEVNAKPRTETIRGVTVPVPADLPLNFQQRATALKDSERDEDVRELVGLIFGEGILDRWIEAGMGAREFQVVCAWGYANGSGNATTFREAYDIVMQAAAEGKAPTPPNRAARRAATNKRSSAGGASSKRTSSASTGSMSTQSAG
jgi:hypothetical protein